MIAKKKKKECYPNTHTQEKVSGISLVVQWLRLYAPNVEDLGSIPGQWTRSHILQLEKRKTLNKETKSWHSQINKWVFRFVLFFFKKRKFWDEEKMMFVG